MSYMHKQKSGMEVKNTYGAAVRGQKKYLCMNTVHNRAVHFFPSDMPPILLCMVTLHLVQEH